jgi:twitching motility protein PilU
MILKPVLELMAAKKAQDVFVSAGTPIHISINGAVLPINQQNMTPDVIKKMAYEIMTEKQIKAFEENLEVNLALVAEKGNYRVSVFRQRGSVALVIRYISFDIPSLKSLNLPLVLNELIMEKRGLILVVGGTGSGKSSAIAAMLNFRIAAKTGHVLTLEDPVEFLFTHKKSLVNQRDVGSDTHSYTNGLKNALRQAPDCLLIGEIRDGETMTHAMSFSLSGHLCVATLHANNAYHTMNRIIQLFPLESRSQVLQDLAVSLKAIVALRLVPGKDGGRVPAVELLVNTRRIAELIEHGDITQIKEAMESSLSPSLQTFDQSLLKLFRSERITWETALSYADSATNLSLQVNATELDKATSQSPAAARPSAGGGVSFDFALPVDEPEKD